MKKIAIVLFVASAALAGCGKKKAPAAPAGDTSGSATAPAGDTAGSGDAAGSAAPDAAGGGGGSGM
jgi:hypothetical protein